MGTKNFLSSDRLQPHLTRPTDRFTSGKPMKCLTNAEK